MTGVALVASIVVAGVFALALVLRLAIERRRGHRDEAPRDALQRLGRLARWLIWLVFPVIGRPDRAERCAAACAEADADEQAREEALAPYHRWEARQDPEALAAYRADLAKLSWLRRGSPRHHVPLMRKHGIEAPPRVTPPLNF